MTGLNESRMIATPTFGASVLASTRTPMHAQHGTTLLIGVEQPVAVHDAHGVTTARALFVPPDVAHAVVSEGPLVAFLYDCEAIPDIARDGDRPRPVELPAVHSHRASLFDPRVLDGLAREVAPRSRRRRFDKRVQRALEALRAFERPNVEISEAHLQALFARDVGVPMRTYRLWQRLMHAVVSLRELDATRAAHAAGFADLAHFSRTCRRMLGYSPTDMREGLAVRR